MDRDAPQLPAVLILWGIPGAGKTEFAKWLIERLNGLRIDSDELSHQPLTVLEVAWLGVIRAEPGAPAAFMRAARSTGRPIVVEYGVWAVRETIELLGQLQTLGAEPWWFDSSPRAAALQAWRERNRRVAEQRRAGSPIESPMFFSTDEPWYRVVITIEANWDLLKAFYGPTRMLVTVTATDHGGYCHSAPSTIYEMMTAAGDP
jgi:hypothetical protein